MAKQSEPKFTFVTDTGSARFPGRLAAIQAACQIYFPRHTFQIVDFREAGWRTGGGLPDDADTLICQIPGFPRKIISCFGTAENLKRHLARLEGGAKPPS